jgi:hypothetical protein
MSRQYKAKFSSVRKDRTIKCLGLPFDTPVTTAVDTESRVLKVSKSGATFTFFYEGRQLVEFYHNLLTKYCPFVSQIKQIKYIYIYVGLQ